MTKKGTLSKLINPEEKLLRQKCEFLNQIKHQSWADEVQIRHLLIFRYDEDGNLVECAAPNASVLSQMAKKIADTNDDEIIIGKDGEIINKSEIQRQKTQSRLSRKNTERK